MKRELTIPPRLAWLPWAAGALLAMVIIASWMALNEKEGVEIRRVTAAAGKLVESLIRRDFDGRIASLEALAIRWELADGTPRRKWEADAESMMRNAPGYQAIEWADASLHIRWIVPLEGNEAIQGFNLEKSPEAYTTALNARDTGHAALTPPVEFDQGNIGLVVYMPIINESKQFTGLLIALIGIQPWLDAVFLHDDTDAYHVAVAIGDQLVYRQGDATTAVNKSWVEQRAFDLQGLKWSVQVSPTPEFLVDIHSRLSTIVLIFGILLSALLGWLIYFGLKVHYQARLLDTSASRLATLLKNLPGVVYRCFNREKWPMEFVSEGSKALSGYEKQDFEQQRTFWNDLIHCDDRGRVWLEVQNALSAGKPFELEYRLITADGEEKWVWERGRAVTEKIDERTLIDGFITDITDQKNAQKQLIRAESYAKAVVDSVVEAVISIDENGAIETFNGAAQKMFGYTLEDVLEKSVQMLLPPQFRDEYAQYLSGNTSSDFSKTIGNGRDVYAKRRNDTVFPIHLSISEITSQEGRKFVGLIRDLSDQRTAERNARKQREQIAHADRLNLLGEMATGIAHEINQPLSAISMYAQSGLRFLGAEPKKLDRLHDALEKLSDQAQRAGAIIERIQHLAKQRGSEREEIDCNKLVEEVRGLIEAEARIRDLEIELDLDQNLCTVFGDSVQLQQVMINLVRNGLEATATNDKRNSNHVVLRTKSDIDGISVSVIDAGAGIPEDAAARLFQPFSSTKETGMGMGLSICRSIIDAHAGQMGFFNNEKCGATFYFTVPHTNQDDR